MELIVKKRNGNTENFNVKKIRSLIDKICDGVEDVCAANITNEVIPQLYNGITTDEILKLLVLTTKAKIEEDPNYSYVAARFLLSKIYKEAGVQTQSSYKRMFVSNMQRLVTAGRLDERILLLDLDKLSQYLRPERDLKFKYLGLQTLYDRYFIHIKKQRLETPQAFWMRVAIGVSLREDKPEDWAIKFYDVMSQFLYCPGSPTLFHSGTPAPQLSSCFLTTIDDSIDGIFGTMHDQARLSKYAGGLGIDVTPLRGTNSHIKGTNGESSGLIPWLKDYDTMLVSVNQSGKRRGSGGFYLEPWHIDIEDFIDIKEHGGDEYRRCHNINTALWIPDAFMEAVESNSDWFLFSPDEVPGLHDSYGEAFDKLYESYKEKALTGQLLQYRVVKAKELAKKILRAVFETGHPWLCFKDPSNLRYMQQDEGVIYSSNLCTEVFRHSIATIYDRWGLKAQPGEVAVCTIGSTNLSEHVEDGEIDFDKLQRSLFIGNRILDNVIDENYYPIPETMLSHMKHRPVGMGLMGFADTLHKLEIPYASNEAVELAGTVQEFICYNMIQSSIELAKERGPFPSFDNSEWAKGKLPFDSYEAIASRRKNALPLKLKICQDSWDDLREDLLDYGIRNASLMAIAPTATISYVTGCSQSGEPDFSMLHVYSTMSGDFTMINEFFVAKCKELGIWGQELREALKRVDGEITKLKLPPELKSQFLSAFEIPYEFIIDATAKRQQFTDMGISMNLYCDIPSMFYLYKMYEHAYQRGLKSTYYLRSKGISKVEKSSVTQSSETCRFDGGCEVCQ
jgi:ribonucleoside-diphosphate reductase alpha chain